MFNRMRANLTLTPLINILNESGSQDSSMFESRHINGYLGYKFRSRSIGLPVEGVYEVTVTKDHFGYNIAAELGYGDALYILCIPTDCKRIIGRFSIPELDIEMEGEVEGKDANNFIQIFKTMYDRRDKSSQGYMNCKYNVLDIKRDHLQGMLSCNTIVIKDQKQRKNTTLNPILNEITLEKQNRTGREKDMIVFSSKGNANKVRIEINIEEIVQLTNQFGQFHIETYEARIFKF